jgi:hypothetical protein
MVGKFDAAAQLQGPTLGQQATAEDAARDERQVLQLLDEFGIE